MVDFDFATLHSRSFHSEAAKKVEALAAEKADGAEGKLGTVKAINSGRSDVFKINPFLIKVKPGFNARDFTAPENREHVLNIARSIAEIGFMPSKPLTVFSETDQLWLEDGEVRLLATLYAIEVLGAEIESVPVTVSPKGQNEADRIAAQVVHNSGKPFSPLEQANVVKRLIGFGWTPSKVASVTGISQPRQSQLLEVSALPEAVKTLVSEGVVSANLAVATVKSEGNAEAVKTLTEAAETAKAEVKAGTKATAKVMPKAIKKATPATPAKSGPIVTSLPSRNEPTTPAVKPIDAIAHNAVYEAAKAIFSKATYTTDENGNVSVEIAAKIEFTAREYAALVEEYELKL